ncbi:MAG: homoserine kinase [Peptococcaceae bacterium]|nr:homoserine kinase [Candidatus Syntrophopropionicum ammoniitolerans]
MIRVQVPATTANLGPGFDCIGMALELHNVVEMTPISRGMSIEVFGEGASTIPKDENNLVYRSARHVFNQAGCSIAGLKIRLFNQIPIARGLGSSTAAIVGGIIAANMLTGRKLSLRDMITLASSIEGHPDNVSPAILGGIVVSVNDSGEIRYLKIEPPSRLRGVVAIPDFNLVTKASRELIPSQIPFQDAVFNVGRVALLVAALHQGDLSMLSVAMEDRLHQTFRSPLIPGLKKVLAAAKLAGARGVTLSGSGPSVIAFADANFELIARVMGDTFRQNGVMPKVLVLKPSPIGARALEIK